MTRESELKAEFHNQYRVVGEWISHSTLYEMNDHSGVMGENAIIENDGFANNYWAIVSLDEDGCYMDTIEDNFGSPEEAWKRYDEMEMDYIKERLREINYIERAVEKSEKKVEKKA